MGKFIICRKGHVEYNNGKIACLILSITLSCPISKSGELMPCWLIYEFYHF